MASAELVVIRRTVGVVGVGADVGELDGDQAPLARLADHAVLEGPLEGFRK